jgi:hypothetical protein
MDSSLSPQQLQVITLLSEGVNSTDAAAQAGVHRNTIAHWRRNYPPFRESLAHAQYDRAIFFREKAEGMVDLACQTLHNLLKDPTASPSVRLKAAIFIIEKASTPPPPKPPVPFDIEKLLVAPTPPVPTDAQIVPPVHNNAQSAQTPIPGSGGNPPSAHNNAQSAQTPIRRETPKVGRNELCPCGSGQKHKRCCLNRPQAMAA